MSNQSINNSEYTFEEKIRKLSIEEAKFVLEHGEKKLKEISDATQLIIARTLPALTIVVGFIIALLGFSFNKLSEKTELYDPYIVTPFIAIYYLYRISRKLVNNIKAEDYKPLGLDPKVLLGDSFFPNQNDDDDDMEKNRLTYFYMNEAHNIQGKIDSNNLKNENRWAIFNSALSEIIFTPLLICLTFAIAKATLYLVEALNL